MLAVQGYYDGVGIRFLDDIVAKPNQKVIVTVLDEFVEPSERERPGSLRGALSKHANPSLAKQEEGAWAREMVKKHGHT